ncbi:MAG: hypothetical protein LBS21_10685 [Clostridiales bacterium]|jgi:hypothetical protein|nr:hypothetical protein [Clostridiales bacterium]
MKILKAILLLFLATSLTGCEKYNDKDDVKHLSEKEITKYVSERVFEDISLTDTQTKDNGNLEYTFNINSRDIPFTVDSVIDAPYFSVDLTDFFRTGDYYLDIRIHYFDSIVDYYKSESQNSAKERGIDLTADGDIKINNFSGIKNAAEYIAELDRLYAFNASWETTRRELTAKIYINDLRYDNQYNSSVSFYIESVPFSASNETRLEFDKVYEHLINEYIREVKRYGVSDATIPTEINDK